MVRTGAQALRARARLRRRLSSRLFDGGRKEDTLFNQESEPADLEKDKLAKPNAPPRPNYRGKSLQAL